MAILKPFKGLRPKPEFASAVSCNPHTNLTTKDLQQLVTHNPYSFLRVVHCELEVQSHQGDFTISRESLMRLVEKQARENFLSLIKNNILLYDQEAHYYIYQLVSQGKSLTGVIGCCAINEFDQGIIKKHEKIFPEKVRERTALLINVSANPGPVFLIYRKKKILSDLLKAEIKTAPIYDFTDDDGVQHRLWVAQNTAAFSEAVKEIPNLYIADGHHRIASAVDARNQLKAKNENHTGQEEYNYFLAGVFPDDEALILPYNRVVKSLNGKTPESILAQISEACTLEKKAIVPPTAKGHCALYIGGKWYGVKFKDTPKESDNPLESLDVTRLQEQILEPIFDIQDQVTTTNVDYISGIRGIEELVRLVDSGKAACAFALYPTGIEELLKVADLGLDMVPKATWFEPKLRAGLIIHQIL